MRKLLTSAALVASTFAVFELSSQKVEAATQTDTFVEASLQSLKEETFDKKVREMQKREGNKSFVDTITFKQGDDEVEYTFYSSTSFSHIVGYYALPFTYYHEKDKDYVSYQVTSSIFESVSKGNSTNFNISIAIPVLCFGLSGGYEATTTTTESFTSYGGLCLNLNASAESGEYVFYIEDVRYDGYVHLKNKTQGTDKYYYAKNVSYGNKMRATFSKTKPAIPYKSICA